MLEQDMRSITEHPLLRSEKEVDIVASGIPSRRGAQSSIKEPPDVPGKAPIKPPDRMPRKPPIKEPPVPSQPEDPAHDQPMGDPPPKRKRKILSYNYTVYGDGIRRIIAY